MYRIYYSYYKRKPNWKDVADVTGNAIIDYIESETISGLNVQWIAMLNNFDCFNYGLLTFKKIEEIKENKRK